MESLFAGSFPSDNRSGTDCLLALIQTSLVALIHSRIYFFLNIHDACIKITAPLIWSVQHSHIAKSQLHKRFRKPVHREGRGSQTGVTAWLRDASCLDDKACFVFCGFFFFFLWMNLYSCMRAVRSCLYVLDGEIPTFPPSNSHHSAQGADNVKEVGSRPVFLFSLVKGDVGVWWHWKNKTKNWNKRHLCLFFFLISAKHLRLLQIFK